MGLDNLASPVEQEEKDESRSACSPLAQRTASPILKRIGKPFSNLLDSRKVTPSKTNMDIGPVNPPRRFSTTTTENSCGECNKKLSGKTVRLPDTQVRYHWKCLKCKSCALPFEDTSFFIDSFKRVYHPNVSKYKIEPIYSRMLTYRIYLVRSTYCSYANMLSMLSIDKRELYCIELTSITPKSK